MIPLDLTILEEDSTAGIVEDAVVGDDVVDDAVSLMGLLCW